MPSLLHTGRAKVSMTTRAPRDETVVAGAMPQVELHNMTQAQLIQCANTFYNGWTRATQEVEASRQRLTWASTALNDTEWAAAGDIARLESENTSLRQQLAESMALGRALHKRAIGLAVACSGEAPASAVLARDQLVDSQARVLELERLLRAQMPPDVGSILETNAVLQRQRADDVARIAEMSERLAEASKSRRRRDDVFSVIGADAMPITETTSIALSKPDGAQQPAAPRTSRGCQTLATTRGVITARHPHTGEETGGELRQHIKILQQALAQKEAIIADLHALPLEDTWSADTVLGATMTIQKLRRELAEKSDALEEAGRSVQQVMERFSSLSAEAAELRVGLRETRASRAKIAAEMKEARIVTPSRLRELLKMAESVKEFERQKSHFQRRDRLCAELELTVAEQNREIFLLKRSGEEQAASQAAAIAECTTLRAALHESSLVSQGLASRLSLMEASSHPGIKHQASQVDLTSLQLLDLKRQLTMAMNDCRYLEHEALIREEFSQGVSRVARGAIKRAVAVQSELINRKLQM